MEIGVYSLLPLIAFFANVILGCYIIYRNPRDILSRLYAMVAFSLAVWAISDFLVFTSLTPEAALFWDRFTTLGSSFVPAFLLHFFIVFTRKGHTPNRLYIILMYIPGLFFAAINFTTSLITESVETSYWGYNIIHGILYIPDTIYVTTYIIIGILLCYRLYTKSVSVKEKREAKLLISAVSVPLVGGVITEVIFPASGLVAIPLSTTFTTATAIIIAYSIMKYGFMIITPRMVAERIIETISDSIVAVDNNDNISFINRAATDILGYKEGDLVGKPLGRIITSDGITGFRVSKELGKDLKNFETELVKRDKKSVFVSVNTSTIRDKRKDIIGHVLVLRDIRETTELIKTLREKTNELEKKRKKIRKSRRVFVRESGRMRIG